MRIPLLILAGLLLANVTFAAGPSSFAHPVSLPLALEEPLDSNFHHPAFYPVSAKTTMNTLILGMGALMVGVVVLAAATRSPMGNQYYY